MSFMRNRYRGIALLAAAFLPAAILLAISTRAQANPVVAQLNEIAQQVEELGYPEQAGEMRVVVADTPPDVWDAVDQEAPAFSQGLATVLSELATLELLLAEEEVRELEAKARRSAQANTQPFARASASTSQTCDLSKFEIKDETKCSTTSAGSSDPSYTSSSNTPWYTQLAGSPPDFHYERGQAPATDFGVVGDLECTASTSDRLAKVQFINVLRGVAVAVTTAGDIAAVAASLGGGIAYSAWVAVSSVASHVADSIYNEQLMVFKRGYNTCASLARGQKIQVNYNRLAKMYETTMVHRAQAESMGNQIKNLQFMIEGLARTSGAEALRLSSGPRTAIDYAPGSFTDTMTFTTDAGSTQDQVIMAGLCGGKGGAPCVVSSTCRAVSHPDHNSADTNVSGLCKVPDDCGCKTAFCDVAPNKACVSDLDCWSEDYPNATCKTPQPTCVLGPKAGHPCTEATALTACGGLLPLCSGGATDIKMVCGPMTEKPGTKCSDATSCGKNFDPGQPACSYQDRGMCTGGKHTGKACGKAKCDRGSGDLSEGCGRLHEICGLAELAYAGTSTYYNMSVKNSSSLADGLGKIVTDPKRAFESCRRSYWRSTNGSDTRRTSTSDG
jgi:hypothetical protein